MKIYQINVPDNFSEEELSKILASLDISLVNEKSTFIKGSYLPNEKPINFTPIWEKDERSLETIRDSAWKRK